MENVTKGSALFQFVGKKLTYDLFKKASFVPGVHVGAFIEASNALDLAFFPSHPSNLKSSIDHHDRGSIERAFELALKDVNVEFVKDDLMHGVRSVLDLAFESDFAFESDDVKEEREIGAQVLIGPRLTAEEKAEAKRRRAERRREEEERMEVEREKRRRQSEEPYVPRKKRRTVQEELNDVLSKLPPEAWNVVFSYLPSIADLVRFGRVSKDAFVMIKIFVARLFPEFIVRDDDTLVSFSDPDKVMHSIVSLDLTSNLFVRYSSLAKFVNLRELKMLGADYVNYSVVEHFPRLETLEIDIQFVATNFFVRLPCSQTLKRLKLVSPGSFHVAEALTTSHFPKLIDFDYEGPLWHIDVTSRSLRREDNRYFKKDFFVDVVLDRSKLGKVYVYHKGVGYSKAYNARFDALEKLTIHVNAFQTISPVHESLTHPHDVTQPGGQERERMRLEMLEREMERVKQQQLNEIDCFAKVWEALSGLERLETLVIKGTLIPKKVTDAGFSALSALKRLTSLTINTNDMHLLANFVNLTELNVPSPKGEHERGDYEPLTRLVKLKRLSVPHRIGKDGSLIGNLTALTYLDISYSENTFFYWGLLLTVNPLQHFTHLVQLIVEGCDGFTGEYLKDMKHLTTLYVENCGDFIDEYLDASLSNVVELHTDEIISRLEFFSSMPKLLHLYLRPLHNEKGIFHSSGWKYWEKLRGLKTLSFLAYRPDGEFTSFWNNYFEYAIEDDPDGEVREVDWVFEHYLTGLETLRIEGASTLQDGVLELFTNLTSLTLLFCESVTEESLSELTGLTALSWRSKTRGKGESIMMLSSLIGLKHLALDLRDDYIAEREVHEDNLRYTKQQKLKLRETLRDRKIQLASGLPYLDGKSRSALTIWLEDSSSSSSEDQARFGDPEEEEPWEWEGGAGDNDNNNNNNNGNEEEGEEEEEEEEEEETDSEEGGTDDEDENDEP